MAVASYPGPSQKAGEGLVRTVCACALISRHSGNSVTRTDTSVSFDVTTVYYPVLVLDFSLASRGLCPPVSSLRSYVPFDVCTSRRRVEASRH